MHELTISEAATLAGVTRSYIWFLVKTGTLAARRAGHIWLVDPESFEKWRENRCSP